jgi:acetyltransferase-like isoleucine patch superfamily enzyme
MKKITHHPPKILEKIMGTFPVLFLLSVSMIAVKLHLGLALIILYILPPLLLRTLQMFYPMTEGVSYLGKKTSFGNMWFVSYQLQLIFTTFGVFEKILILLPGCYSFWLRLWGAKIGKKINWTPECKIVDRSLLSIGDRVLIGNRSYISSHVIKKKDGKYLLWVAPVSIGHDSVLAFSSVLSAGVVVGNNCFVEAGAGLYPGTVVKDGETYARN